MTVDRLYRSLEHRFDGEIPDHLRRLALAGGEDALGRAILGSASRSCDRQALLALKAAAAGRAQALDLARWRLQGLATRDRAVSF